MTPRAWVVIGALTASVAGMMLVIGGVLTRGLFLPGVVLLVLGLVGWAAAGVLHMLDAA